MFLTGSPTAKGYTPNPYLSSCPEANSNPAEGTGEIHQTVPHQGPAKVNSANRGLFKIRQGRTLVQQLPQLSAAHWAMPGDLTWKSECSSVGVSSVPHHGGPAPSVQEPQTLSVFKLLGLVKD